MDKSCFTCQETFPSKDCVVPCEAGHAYHKDCAKIWLTAKKKCPACEKPETSASTSIPATQISSMDYESLKEHAEFLNVKASELYYQVEDLTMANSVIEETNIQLQREQQLLQEQLQKLQDQSENKTVLKDIVELEKEYKSVQNENQELRKDNKALKAELKILRLDNKSMQCVIDNGQKENKQFRFTLEDQNYEIM